MTVSFAPEAEIDFAAMVDYLADRNPSAAERFATQVFSVIDRLASKELEGPVTTLSSGEAVRSWPVPPVRSYYQRPPSGLWVVRIYHHARAPIAE